MTLRALVEYAPLLNVLLVLLIPAVIWLLRVDRRLLQIVAAIQAHERLDEEIHAGVRRDIARVETNSSAAHRRLDYLRAPAAPPL